MSVADLVRERIWEHGPITFAEYMDICLYAPGTGYYTSGRPRVGAGGDFITSPAIHPAFGALLALALETMWRALGRPDRFVAVEMGAGDGRLARDILAYVPHLEPGFGDALEYVAVERGLSTEAVEQGRCLSLSKARPPSPMEGAHSLRRAQETGLADLPANKPEGSIHWLSALEELEGPVMGGFLSNELMDAFPVHRVVMRQGRLWEVYVGLREEQLVELEMEPSTPELAAYFDRLGIALAEGQRAEVNLRMKDWLSEVSPHLERGFVLTIDIGHPAAELYSACRHRGTLISYYRHLTTEDPYLCPGEQDLIAQVDFTTLASWGEEVGLRPAPLRRQQDLLLNLGLGEFLRGLSRLGLPQEGLYANRLALLELIRDGGLGGFGVLLQAKGVEAHLPWKAEGASGLPVPLLSPEHVPLMLSRYPDYAFDAAALW